MWHIEEVGFYTMCARLTWTSSGGSGYVNSPLGKNLWNWSWKSGILEKTTPFQNPGDAPGCSSRSPNMPFSFFIQINIVVKIWCPFTTCRDNTVCGLRFIIQSMHHARLHKQSFQCPNISNRPFQRLHPCLTNGSAQWLTNQWSLLGHIQAKTWDVFWLVAIV
jgi:hypothetical protein